MAMNEKHGLKKLRNNPKEKRTMCENCKCERYGKCGCMKREKK